jgi:alpha-L-rhamnosidase
MNCDLRVRLADVSGRLFPLGLDEPAPVFHYLAESAEQGKSISACQLLVQDESGLVIWDSGKSIPPERAYLPYQGAPLAARSIYSAQIRVWDEQDKVSPFSESLQFETGLMGQPWQARWIEPVQENAIFEKALPLHQLFVPSPEFWGGEARLRPCQNVRKTFTCQRGVKRARAYVSAHGVYQLSLNGQVVGQQRLAPETSVYAKILYYQTYDLTSLLQSGENALGLTLADGWWIGRLGISGESCNYGQRLGLIVQLEILYEDGRREFVTSDSSFKSAEAMIRSADLFIGEKQDLRLDDCSWRLPGFNDANWQACLPAAFATDNLTGQMTDGIRVLQELPCIGKSLTPCGDLVLDFGQVIAGVCRFCVTAQEGQTVSFEHGEVLDQNGNFKNNIIGRNKDQKDVLVCRAGRQVFEPLFTYHGFRYVRVVGVPPEQVDAVALVLGTPLQKTGIFSCSDERLNRLQHAIEWSTRGNMVSVPTDCPQREKLGWTGDIQVFARTGCFNFNLKNFLETWLCNLRADQSANGEVPVVVPNHPSQDRLQRQLSQGLNSSSGWSDACVLVPYYLYQHYGDPRVLRDCFPVMERWLDFVKRQTALEPDGFCGYSEERQAANLFLWTQGYHFGDWLIPSLRQLPNGVALGTEQTAHVVGACFYAITVEAFGQICRWLGYEQKAFEQAALLDQIRQAIRSEFVRDDGRVAGSAGGSDLQGLYVMVLRSGAVTGSLRVKVVQRLVDLIIKNEYCLDTGFSSVSYLLDVLYDNGYPDIAYQILFQTRAPSWLYMIERGATTIWENWRAITETGEVTDSSYNHYAFGCVGDWIYRRIGGITPVAPGYRAVRIAPDFSCGLAHAHCALETPQGMLRVDWTIQAGQIELALTIPVDTHAVVHVPGADHELGSGAYSFIVNELN